MVIKVDAVYENGVIKPEKPIPGLADRERITVTVERPEEAKADPEEILRLLRASFEGLTDEQIKIIDSARLGNLRDPE